MNVNKRFNTNIKPMNNSKKILSSTIQMMVQNYLEHTYNIDNVHMYPELINDIDVLVKDINDYKRMIEDETISDLHDIDLRVLVDVIGKDYLQSIEVKSGEVEYLATTENIVQLITKIHYPNNTKLLMVFVPTRHNINIKTVFSSKAFEQIKQSVSQKSENDQYKIFNALCNDQEFLTRNINASFMSIMIRLKKGELKYDFGEKNLKPEEFEWIKENFMKVEFKTLTLEDLERYPISPEFLHEYVCSLISDDS